MSCVPLIDGQSPDRNEYGRPRLRRSGRALCAALERTPAADGGRRSARWLPPSVPTGRPTNAEFPSSASTPAVSIMTPEPGTGSPNGQRPAQPAAAAPKQASSPPPPASSPASALASAKKPPAAKRPAAPTSIAPAPAAPAQAQAQAPASSDD